MKRIAKTSKGWLELDLLGDEVRARRYGEDGWEELTPPGRWHAQFGPEPTLAAFISKFAKLPKEESKRLTSEVLGEWEERRKSPAVEEQRRFKKGLRLAVATALVAAVALVAVLVTLAVLLWHVVV